MASGRIKIDAGRACDPELVEPLGAERLGVVGEGAHIDVQVERAGGRGDGAEPAPPQGGAE